MRGEWFEPFGGSRPPFNRLRVSLPSLLGIYGSFLILARLDARVSGGRWNPESALSVYVHAYSLGSWIVSAGILAYSVAKLWEIRPRRATNRDFDRRPLWPEARLAELEASASLWYRFRPEPCSQAEWLGMSREE